MSLARWWNLGATAGGWTRQAGKRQQQQQQQQQQHQHQKQRAPGA